MKSTTNPTPNDARFLRLMADELAKVRPVAWYWGRPVHSDAGFELARIRATKRHGSPTDNPPRRHMPHLTGFMLVEV